MRVLILNSARKFIGEAAHCLDLTRELKARGHDALLILRDGHEVQRIAHEMNLPAKALTFSSEFSLRRDCADVIKLKKIVREWKADIVHCHRGKDHWIAAFAKLLSFSQFPPIIRTRHVVVPMAQHLANKWLMSQVTCRTIAVSRAAAASLGSIGEHLGDRLRIIYSAVDCRKFSPEHRSESIRQEFGVSADDKLIGLIARIQNVKGQKVFLRAARLVNKLFPNTRFLIAGRGSALKFEAIANLAKDLGIEHCVVVREWLPNVPAVLASLDISVVASLGSEGSSRIAYESMASGVPLVATTVGCLPEIIDNRQTGLLVPPAEPEALAGAICELLRNQALSRGLAANALQRVREFHSHDRWIKEILEVYEQALSPSGGGRSQVS
ncbi:MAG: glycosyltransferase family 4 protein [Candidatus Sumerlaeaceae bacterium]|nr:glycosyltransferase family 4 protein [Candidatus Sumerlaeaceae bacterium]